MKLKQISSFLTTFILFVAFQPQAISLTANGDNPCSLKVVTPHYDSTAHKMNLPNYVDSEATLKCSKNITGKFLIRLEYLSNDAWFTCSEWEYAYSTIPKDEEISLSIINQCRIFDSSTFRASASLASKDLSATYQVYSPSVFLIK